jgi:hypothetical protein
MQCNFEHDQTKPQSHDQSGEPLSHLYAKDENVNAEKARFGGLEIQEFG